MGVRRVAPQKIGQDNAEVYSELLGIEAEELAGLRHRGIV
jgi:crotonobetainyl-CoA:carnitine CoA-transferase CaiB-like acyl-CoA transferase